jgi:hypothetical protein
LRLQNTDSVGFDNSYNPEDEITAEYQEQDFKHEEDYNSYRPQRHAFRQSTKRSNNSDYINEHSIWKQATVGEGERPEIKKKTIIRKEYNTSASNDLKKEDSVTLTVPVR